MLALLWLGGWAAPMVSLLLRGDSEQLGVYLGTGFALVFGGVHLMRRKRDKVAIPYGIAISFAGLWVLANQYLPAIQTGSHIG